MVMDQFVTTYRKEYLWPYVQTIGLKPEPEKLYQPQHIAPKDLCECHKLPKPRETNAQRVLFGPDALKEESWSRLGPMGPLLDPKIYPARVSDVPQTHIGRYNQPNVFMQKLQEKYPFIYECLRTAPPDDLISRIHRDRLRSTYMVDFCKLSEYPDAPYEELLRSAGVNGEAPCAVPIKLPGDPCNPKQKSTVTKGGYMPRTTGNRKTTKSAEKKDFGNCEEKMSMDVVDKSEYQDRISKLGEIIIRDKFSSFPKKPGRLKESPFIVSKEDLEQWE